MIVTDQDDCFNGTLPEDDDEEINFEKLILKISALTSLICLTLTVIVYIIFPSPDTQKEKKEKDKIVLVNVVFTALFSILYFLFHLINPSTFQIDCQNIFCG